ncbi:aminotransferase [Flavimaricola marinus]|uniref:Adenosylmethionine-8-amino-7-oxononanoate aminotransferase n=1 Tax=Flavimaricola marinus TaxID=1819565 RepID=A0A238LJ26_9RHOB|nr:aminotransferase [Flavimaricola marinus]SMY09628.1 Adenosylmethionine-8-amino-7-oxononanoate aminotransferase [Flavimaricola marinus]
MTQDLSPLAAMDQAHALHPWTHFDSFETEGAVVLTRGEGVWLWDDAGRKYLDAVGGLWCTNIGLGRADMAQAIADQALKLAFTSTFVDITNAPAARLAGKLAELAPGDLNRVHFTTGGSTAIDSAYRLAQYVQAARGFSGRTHVIARKQSYHGSTYAAMSIGLRDGDRVPEFTYKSDTIHHVSAPILYRRAEGQTEAQLTDALVAEFEAKIAEVGAEKIAAFFAEPIQASGGVLVPPQDYLARMAAVCRKHGILVIADEVVTGFGRLGAWFASQDVYGFTPDMICCAKGLSSGYQPIGAVIFSDALWDDMRGDKWFTSGYTYSGHPVACAAALKNIEIIENEDILARATRAGALFQEGLRSLSDLPIVGDVRGHTLIGCVENVADKATKRAFPDEVDIGRRVTHAAEARGLMVRPLGALNVMSPALIISDSEITQIVETLGAAITAATDDLVREGIKVG